MPTCDHCGFDCDNSLGQRFCSECGRELPGEVLPAVPPPLPQPAVENTSGPVYGGFWIRLGALLLDNLVSAPVTYGCLWINSLNRYNFFYTEVFSLAFFIFIQIVCVKRWGGSPGKLICGLRIITVDFKPVGWREAWLRHSVMLGLAVLSLLPYIHALGQMTDSEFTSLSILGQAKRITELGGSFQLVLTVLMNIWVWSEFVVMLTNHQRRALHDFIAGTVVIQTPKSA